MTESPKHASADASPGEAAGPAASTATAADTTSAPPPSAGAGTSVRRHRPEPASLLALRPGQTEFDQLQLAALRQLGIGNPNREDLAVFFHQCRRTGLDPFLRQIYLITRMTWNPDSQQREPRATIQTGIDGFRLVVRRGADKLHAKLHHEGPLWCGVDGVWRDIWPNPDEPPFAAKYTIFLDGEPFPGIAHFHEFAATKDEYTPDRVEDGRKIKGQKTGRKVPSGKWVPPVDGGMPAHMIAKCAEALASRKAFPQDLSGIYIDEEMERWDAEAVRVVPNGKLVIEGPGEPSGRDWLAEIAATESGDEVNELWFEIKGRGELTAEIQAAITARGVHFRDRLRAEREEAGESADLEPDPEP